MKFIFGTNKCEIDNLPKSLCFFCFFFSLSLRFASSLFCFAVLTSVDGTNGGTAFSALDFAFASSLFVLLFS